MLQRFLVGSLLIVGVSASARASDYSRERVYRVTITNLTRGQVFSPPVIATHRASVGFFELGAPASDELAAMAENGKGAPLAAVLSSKPQVYQARATMTPIVPHRARKHRIVRDPQSFSFRPDISVAGMLVNTNDTFFAVDARSLPERRWRKHTFTAVAYDAGSELNSEDCNYIPGPACGTMSQERDPGMPEGYVYVSNGIHGLFPDLLPSDHYDWHNPVARVTVQRIR